MVSIQSQQLADFLRSRGSTVHESLEFFARRASGTRGVFAAAPIACGECLLRLPKAAVLAACELDGCEWMPEGARNASPILRTALCLLRERALGEQSAWEPYLATIPDDRWLSQASKMIFSAGFNWKVVDQKWPAHEVAFDTFVPAAIAHFPDERLHDLRAPEGLRVLRRDAEHADVRLDLELRGLEVRSQHAYFSLRELAAAPMDVS